ncbi:(5-formylfuran-3-yl)methyl phosphate synthase [Stieleria varia]|uniref:(5-formylfuran-3-yl)methyl phosphate synthase n=1 Tax=Stieleria varia TaxID=2528005 RepID=A0A5C6BA10_9BACT|nr:(5-formylfuran-3-yl)methyl phosphate synthase [Stieleria varia]TWU08271.1 hypothetical protein Pla52n_08530 [Stieleria varia]
MSLTSLSESAAHSQRGLSQEWLVSVSSESEMAMVLGYPVDILDFKDPSSGPLAPSEPSLWGLAVERLASGGPALSAALGEGGEAVRLAGQVPREFGFAKVGPSGCQTSMQVCDLWQSVRKPLADSVKLVGVAYADSAAAHSLSPEEVFSNAARFGLRHVLVDTWSKSGQSSLDILGWDRIRELSSLARRHRLWWSLAGSLTLDIAMAINERRIPVDCLGVRGDLCEGGRAGTLSETRLNAWSAMLPSRQ